MSATTILLGGISVTLLILLVFFVRGLLGSLASGGSQDSGMQDDSFSPFSDFGTPDLFDTDDTLDMGTSTFGSSLSDDAMDLHSEWEGTVINPANGLPMVSGMGGVDVAGNPYGTDSSHDDMFSSFDDPFDNGISDSFSDSFDSFDSFDSGYDSSFND